MTDSHSKHRPKVIPDIHNTYLSVIRNSVGSKIFKNFYAYVDGRKTDILQEGKLSCAFYVSVILNAFKLIEETHTTVKGVVKDLKNCGWFKIKTPQIGSVIVWEDEKFTGGEVMGHIGFYLGGDKAVSNSSYSAMPIVHHYTFGEKNKRPVRRIKVIFWNRKLTN